MRTWWLSDNKPKKNETRSGRSTIMIVLLVIHGITTFFDSTLVRLIYYYNFHGNDLHVDDIDGKIDWPLPYSNLRLISIIRLLTSISLIPMWKRSCIITSYILEIWLTLVHLLTDQIIRVIAVDWQIPDVWLYECEW